MASLFLTNLGTSCIKVSNLVGVLNFFLVSSTYFGFTNSGTNPLDSVITFKYGFKLNTRTFKFPGKSQNPFSFGTSPLPLYFSLNKESN